MDAALFDVTEPGEPKFIGTITPASKFTYPLKPGLDMVSKLGLAKCTQFALSYGRSHVAPVAPEQSLEDFFINRFGRALYHQFFKEYTEKVWGVPCSEISAD